MTKNSKASKSQNQNMKGVVLVVEGSDEDGDEGDDEGGGNGDEMMKAVLRVVVKMVMKLRVARVMLVGMVV